MAVSILGTQKQVQFTFITGFYIPPFEKMAHGSNIFEGWIEEILTDSQF